MSSEGLLYPQSANSEGKSKSAEGKLLLRKEVELTKISPACI